MILCIITPSSRKAVVNIVDSISDDYKIAILKRVRLLQVYSLLLLDNFALEMMQYMPTSTLIVLNS